MNSIESRLQALEQQVKRFCSDLESEKGTRDRSNQRIEKAFQERLADMETRIRSIEKTIWFAAGAVVACQLVLKLL